MFANHGQTVTRRRKMFENLVHEMMKKLGVREPEKYHDKVFFMGEPLLPPVDGLNDHAFNVTGLVRLNERIAGDPIIEALPTVKQLRGKQLYQASNFTGLLHLNERGNSNPIIESHGGKLQSLQLVSAQALLLIKINGQFYLPMSQRGLDAPTDPGVWTLPAGRMDHSNFTLGALMETMEEIRIIGQNTHYLPKLTVLNEVESRRVFQESWTVVREKHAAARAHVNEVKLVETKLFESKYLKAWHIRHDEMLERCDMIMPCWDEDNNTLEAVVPMLMELPEMVEIFDGESYSRTNALVPLAEILSGQWMENNKVTFAIKKVFSDYQDFFKEIL